MWEDCIPAVDNNTSLIGSRVIVKNGHFTTGPLSFAGKPIPPNTYPVEIQVWIDLKTAPIEDLKKIGTIVHSGEVEIDGGGGQNSASHDGDAATFYQSRYFLAGFLLRAGKVCQTNTKQLTDSAFGLLGTSELKTMSKAYPQTTGKWMQAGADNFNIGTMKTGVVAACKYATQVRSEAEELARSDSQ